MSSLMIVLGFFVGIFALLALITIHEFGHFIVARLSKAYVYEFSIGFGPRIFVFKGKETWISIRAFPLGGYCSIASDKVDPPKDREDVVVPKERQMDYIARWKRFFFIIAGPLMNLFIALLLFTIIFASTQVKKNDMSYFGAKYDQNKIAYKLIEKEEKKLLKTNKVDINQQYVIWGWTLKDFDTNEFIFDNIFDEPTKCDDKINEISSQQAVDYKKTVYNFIDNLKRSENHKNVQIMFQYKKVDKFSGLALDGYQMGKITEMSSMDRNDNLYYESGQNVGIASPDRFYKSSNEAYLAGWKETFDQSLSIIKSLGMIFTGHFSQLSGPIGIAGQTATMLQSADQFFLYVAMISANLFILNLMFFPPFDGYKVVELFIEMIIRREIPQKYKIIIYTIGGVLFLGLLIAVTIKDFIV